MQIDNEALKSAAQKILLDCLALRDGSEIAIIFDETTSNIVNFIIDAALDLHIIPLPVFYPKRFQGLWKHNYLPKAIEPVIENVTAVMLCVVGAQDYLAFRTLLRQTAQNSMRQVAHMPGIDVETMLMADIDYEKMRKDCELLAAALVKGRHVKIITSGKFNGKVEEYELNIPLDPFGRMPIISDGYIQRGAWGNVPSGETYIAPQEGRLWGEIVINGSVPGYPLAEGEAILLSFKDGILDDWWPKESPAIQHLFERHIDIARNNGDTNWSVLAELGIGVNEKVTRLTGNPLLDEKMKGSIHIALGRNKDMGGNNASEIHCDLVTIPISVEINQEQIITNGKLSLNSGVLLGDWNSSSVVPNLSNASIEITSKEGRKPNGELRRYWDAGSGRLCSIPVGEGEISLAAARVYEFCKNNGGRIDVNSLLEDRRFNLEREKMLQVISILVEYQLVNVVNGEV
ncbi:aminopeptidase [Chloroflexota bacterium]